jgi:hypothetical protein
LEALEPHPRTTAVARKHRADFDAMKEQTLMLAEFIFLRYLLTLNRAADSPSVVPAVAPGKVIASWSPDPGPQLADAVNKSAASQRPRLAHRRIRSVLV